MTNASPKIPVPPNTVLMTTEDAGVFIAFKRHREKFLTLLNAGVFELDSGKIEININNSQIQNIHTHRMTYQKPRSTM